jgi:hypothetical protein
MCDDVFFPLSKYKSYSTGFVTDCAFASPKANIVVITFKVLIEAGIICNGL